MTRKELLQIPGLGDVLKSLEDSPPPKGALEPPPKCPPNLAAPGEIWRVVENDQQTEDQGYSRTNPHCSTVIILRRQEEPAGEYAVFRAAPVLADIRYCGVEDAIFPREVFGYEAAVACGCEFTLTSKELERCEGVLPDEWFDRLADFAAWMEAEDDETAPAFPPLLKTGRPFTHPEDPGYIFHANLATNLQPLMATVLDDVRETAETGESASQRVSPSRFAPIEFDPEAAMGSYAAYAGYAASTNEPPPPDNLSGDDLLPGFQWDAERDSDAPTKASILRLAFYGPESPRPVEVPTGGVTAEWPEGQSGPHVVEYREAAWRAKIRLNLPWSRAVALLQKKKIRINPVP